MCEEFPTHGWVCGVVGGCVVWWVGGWLGGLMGRVRSGQMTKNLKLLTESR